MQLRRRQTQWAGVRHRGGNWDDVNGADDTRSPFPGGFTISIVRGMVSCDGDLGMGKAWTISPHRYGRLGHLPMQWPLRQWEAQEDSPLRLNTDFPIFPEWL